MQTPNMTDNKNYKYFRPCVCVSKRSESGSKAVKEAWEQGGEMLMKLNKK
jgi:hypothetical protein